MLLEGTPLYIEIPKKIASANIKFINGPANNVQNFFPHECEENILSTGAICSSIPPKATHASFLTS